jgi:hypothetical protein
MVDTGTILTSPFFTEIILPFLLVFTLIFAILERTKILGEGKKQINAIIAFVIGLIFVSFAQAVHIAVSMMGLMAFVAIIILVFMVLFGFVYTGEEFKMPKGLKITFGILIGIVMIVGLTIISGYWPVIKDLFSGGTGGNSILANVIFIAFLIAAVAVVLATSGKSGK